jgi:hypothetical protein
LVGDDISLLNSHKIKQTDLSFGDIPLCERRWSCNKQDSHSTAATALYIAVVVDPNFHHTESGSNPKSRLG